MDRLIEFLRSKRHLLIFLLLEVIALALLFSGSRYRSSVMLSSANDLTGRVMETAQTIRAYTGLEEANVELLHRNAQLEREVLRLHNQLERLSVDSLSWQRLGRDTLERPFPYHYIVGRVVGMVLFDKSNYLTLDIGKLDGVAEDMGVVSTDGVVGIVQAVSDHYSRVVPVINSTFGVSCKVEDSDFVSVLKWDGLDIDHSLLTNIPKHQSLEPGRAVFTSGYSASFPSGLSIGTIVGPGKSPDDSFFAYRVKLSTRFADLKYVYVLQYENRQERTAVEEPVTDRRSV